jgi:hypothetical protein
MFVHALRALHGSGMLPGDLNVNNIIVTPNDVKFTDPEDTVLYPGEDRMRKGTDRLAGALADVSGKCWRRMYRALSKYSRTTLPCTVDLEC